MGFSVNFQNPEVQHNMSAFSKAIDLTFKHIKYGASELG